MSLSRYVSAEWVQPTFPGEPPMIKAIGDDDREYWLPGDDPAVYDVPPWPQFVETATGRAFLQTRPEPDPPEAA